MSREDGTMQSASSYKVRIAENNRKIASAFIYTLDLYRAVVDFYIALVLRHWDASARQFITIATKTN